MEPLSGAPPDQVEGELSEQSKILRGVVFSTACARRPDGADLLARAAHDRAPPAGDSAAHWRLLTTRPMRNAAEAFAVAGLSPAALGDRAGVPRKRRLCGRRLSAVTLAPMR